ncbi:MAG: pitrilysin family protein [Bacillota bacterium]|nr:pitrilysin family protein [Bacillota bacterium]
MSVDFLNHQLSNGIELYFMPSRKFKTVNIALFLHQDLHRDFAALGALVPSVLEKGCRLYPDYLTLQRRLENLYGAELSTDVLKSGERQILAFMLETAHGRYLDNNGTIFQDAMSVLGSVVGDPLVDGNAFRKDYVEQEKNQLIRDIRGLINEKAAYALERCLSLMCAGERFGVYKLGRVEDYRDIEAAELYCYYRRIIAENPLDLYVVGDLEENLVVETAEAVFSGERSQKMIELASTEVEYPVDEVKFIREEMAVNQAKLILGFRTHTGFQDPLQCALLVYSGILGGFPHSKLFMKVREEAGLAYYVHTRLERHKGLMAISAGINAKDYARAREIIEKQLVETAAGEISDIELNNTKQGLINQLLSRLDSPQHLISNHLEGVVGGRQWPVVELIEGIKKVSRADIMAVAERIQPDTVYLLQSRKGGDGENGG